MCATFPKVCNLERFQTAEMSFKFALKVIGIGTIQ